MSFAEDYQTRLPRQVRRHPRQPSGRTAEVGRDAVRRCEHKGCDDLGICKAPKPFAARTIQVPGQRVAPEDSHWFCQRHAAEYNRTYDFFEGMTEVRDHGLPGLGRLWPQADLEIRRRAGRRRRPGGAVQQSPKLARRKDWLYNGAGAGMPASGACANARGCRSGRSTRWACRTAPSPAVIRERYGVLVKQYHPDSNGGDRSMEHRLAIVIRAFKALKASGLA